MLTYFEALAAVTKERDAGFITSFLTGCSRKRGRYIETFHDSAWNPEPFWVEFPDTDRPVFAAPPN